MLSIELFETGDLIGHAPVPQLIGFEMTVRKLTFVIVLCLSMSIAICSQAYATDSKAGTNAYSFLKIPVGAKVPAMGGASAGLADDLSAMHYNPAGITQISGSAVMASHNNYLAGIQGGFLTFVTSWGEQGKIGLAVNYLNYGSIPKTDIKGNKLSDFGGGNIALSATVARRWVSDDEYDAGDVDIYYDEDESANDWAGISAGLTAKFIYESLEEYSSDALAVDAGIVYGLKDNRTRIGASISNLGFQLKSLSSGHKESLPMVLRAGFGHQLKASPFMISGDVIKPNDHELYLAAGINFSGLDPVEIRTGYSTLGQDFKTDSDKDNLAGLSFGLGIKLDKFDFGYAFVPYADLGNSHRIAVSRQW